MDAAPYSGSLADGFIWGRGTLDDKVNILAALEVFEALLVEGYQPERSIYLACGHDEEVGGLNGARAIASHFKLQGIQFEYILDEGSVILNDALNGLNRPAALIGISEKGYTTLELVAKSEQGGHSSMPPAETAIGLLSTALSKLSDHPFPASIDGPMRKLFSQLGPEMDQPFKAVMANLWLFEGLILRQLSTNSTTNAAIRTTVAPTMLRSGVKENVLPTEATAVVNLRIRPGETVETAKAYIREVISDERIEVREKAAQSSANPSPVAGTETFGYRVIEKTSLEVFPEAVVAPCLVIAQTDSRHFHELSQNIYRFFPVRLDKSDLSRIHGIDERISQEGYKNVLRFYRQLVLNSCK